MTYNDELLKYRDSLSRLIRRGIFIDAIANIFLNVFFMFLVSHARADLDNA